jgi:predicted CXXCH cytochrome family protein
MKKLLLAVVLGLLFVAAFSTLALADNGPHGGFNGSTEACASCHRAHSAVSSDGFLLVQADVYTLCTSCHDGTGAYTNVVDGYYDTTIPGTDTHGKGSWVLPAGGWGNAGIGLFGGGFVNARMLTDFGNAANEAANGLANNTTNAAADQNASTTSWARMNAYDPNSVALATGRPVTSNHDVVTAARSGTVYFYRWDGTGMHFLP